MSLDPLKLTPGYAHLINLECTELIQIVKALLVLQLFLIDPILTNKTPDDSHCLISINILVAGKKGG